MINGKTAVLLALREGPTYGRELVRRVGRATRGCVRLSEGTLYPALRTLRVARMIRAWTVIPGRKRGARARTYYELTVAGVERAEGLASVLAGFARGPDRPTSQRDRELMRSRIERVAEISDSLMTLRDAAARAKRLA